MSRSSLRALALAVPAALLLALAAAPAFAVQRTVTIYQIQDTTAVGHFVEGSTDTITTTGIITGADTRGSGYGFYIQDAAGGGYSGVLVFTGGVNVYADSGYARGDIITVTGRGTEFSNETEIISRSGSAFTGVPVTTKIGTAALPAPIALPSYGSIAETAAYPFAERYEGVRVSIVNGVVRNNQGAGFSQFVVVDNAIPGATDSVRIDGFTLANPGVTPPALGVVVVSAQGIGVQRLPRGYGIQLRDGADIVVPSPPTLLNAYATSNATIRLVFDRALDVTTAQNVTNYSRTISLDPIDAATLVGGPGGQIVDLTTSTSPQIPGSPEEVTASGVKSALGVAMAASAKQTFRAGITPIRFVQTNTVEDSSQVVFEQVTVRGVVHARDGGLYYFQEGTAINPSSGMAVFAPIQAMAVGDDVTMSGVVLEFGSASQLTEYSGLDYQFTNATGLSKFAPVVVSPGVLGNKVGAEPFSGEAYEAMLVELQNVTVVGDSLNNGQFNVRGAGGVSDTVRVDDTMYRHQYLYAHGAEFPSVVPFLRGMVNDAFGEYTVNPRNAADISDQTTDVTPGALSTAFAIRSITPTPVSFARGGASLSFTMPSAGRVSARVFDLAGRLVARPLVDEEFAAGPQAFSFDGRSLSGGRLGNGIFFVQLELGNRVATAKLVVTD